MNRIVLAVFSVLVIGCSADAPVKGGLGYQGRSSEGVSAAELLSQLQADPEVEFRTKRGWRIAAIKSERVLYSFTPDNHPAHPSYVKREVVQEEGGIYMKTSVSCGATKNVCDQLVRDFIELNKKIKNSVQDQLK